MRINPNAMQLLAGETGIAEVTEYDPDQEVTLAVVPSGSATLSFSDGVLTVTAGSVAGVKVITLTQGSNTASCTLTITAVSEYTTITSDGSGTGNDASVFGRQFIINENLRRVDSIVNVIQRTVNTIRTLSITNQATNAASLAAITANLVLTINMLQDMTVTVVAAGKNTVTL